MIRIFLAATLVLAVMIVVKDGRVLRRAGVTGSCVSAAVAPDGSETKACRPGKLEGRPDLSGQGCTALTIAGRWEYWSCPAAIARDPRA